MESHQGDEIDALGKGVFVKGCFDQLLGGLQGQTGLAAAPRTDQGQQPAGRIYQAVGDLA